MQSPFSFRRLAPASDYLGSPFSAFFRPLLLGFPVRTSALSFIFLPLDLHFLSSAFVSLPVTRHPVLLFSVLPGSPHSGSPVLIGFFRPLCLSPSVTPDFPCVPSGSAYSAFLYCFLSSFPASLPQPFGRCSPLALTQGVSPWLPFSFVHFRFRLSTTQLLLLPFLFSTVPPYRGLSSFSVPLTLSCFSSFFQHGFPCLPSDSKYSASCLFPFVLPCFAPTAVPQVIPFWISPPGPVPDIRFLSSASVLASHYSASASSFPFFPAFPHSGSLRCLFIHIHFRLFPCFRSCFGTQPSCNSFLRALFRITGATSAADLLFPARPFPLAYALGSGYLTRVIHPEN